MKIYRYCNLTKPHEDTLIPLTMALERKYWLASPDKVNDEDEFRIELDYAYSKDTPSLLADNFLKSDKNLTKELAIQKAQGYINEGALKRWAIEETEIFILKLRNEIGLICFTTLKDDGYFWEKYGGDGNGYCLEIEAPENQIGLVLHSVCYVEEKKFHVDRILKSSEAYKLFLTTKKKDWRCEEEIRFISKFQSEKTKSYFQIEWLKVIEIAIGEGVPDEMKSKIKNMVKAKDFFITEKQIK